MPVYEFRCKKCSNIYEELLDMNESTAKLKCPKCKSKKKDKVFLSPPGCIFTNPVGTSKYDNFEYQAVDRYNKATDERRAAEEASHMGTTPYNDLTAADLNNDANWGKVK